MASRVRTIRTLSVRVCGTAAIIATLGLLGSESGASAADGTTLYGQGATNLARLNTFVEHFSFLEQSNTLRYRNDLVKAFDRKNARVQGQQTLVESRKGADGKWHTGKYVSVIVMLNHKTYVRTSQSKGWSVHSGYGYTDPVTKGRWMLAAPDYRMKGLTFTVIGRSNGYIHLRAHGMKVPETVTVDITTGSTPILARITTTGATSNRTAGKATFVQVTAESNFNKPLRIAAPK